MAKKTFMRVDQDLLTKLRARKQVPRESYADVVSRMIRNETAPTSIQRKLRSMHGVNIFNYKEKCVACGKSTKVDINGECSSCARKMRSFRGF